MTQRGQEEAAERRFDRAWAQAGNASTGNASTGNASTGKASTGKAARDGRERERHADIGLRRRPGARIPPCAAAPRVSALPLHHSPAPCALAGLQREATPENEKGDMR